MAWGGDSARRRPGAWPNPGAATGWIRNAFWEDKWPRRAPLREHHCEVLSASPPNILFKSNLIGPKLVGCMSYLTVLKMFTSQMKMSGDEILPLGPSVLLLLFVVAVFCWHCGYPEMMCYLTKRAFLHPCGLRTHVHSHTVAPDPVYASQDGGLRYGYGSMSLPRASSQ